MLVFNFYKKLTNKTLILILNNSYLNNFFLTTRFCFTIYKLWKCSYFKIELTIHTNFMQIIKRTPRCLQDTLNPHLN